MDRNDFYKKIVQGYETNTEKIIRILECRGFLIERAKDCFLLSDNSHKSDKAYLCKILDDYSLGYMRESRIEIVCENDPFLLFDSLFQPNNKIWTEDRHNDYGWMYYRNHRHGHKVEVRVLEPAIARYVKAASACGVIMTGSCDGGCENEKEAYLQIFQRGAADWHNVIWEQLLLDKFPVNINHNGTKFVFGNNGKYYTYSMLLEAADYLYGYRKELRKIKRKAFEGRPQSFFERESDEVIRNYFISNARYILSENKDILCLNKL